MSGNCQQSRCRIGQVILRQLLTSMLGGPQRSESQRPTALTICYGPRGSGKEVLSPAPPPLRTGRAPLNASGSSIEQRLCVARPGSVPPAHDTPSRDAVSPSALGSTWTLLRQGQLPRFGGGCTYGRCRPRQICFAPRAGRLSVHVRRHPGEVGSLWRGVMSQPLSGPLQVGLRFLPRPLPAAPSARLAAGLPSREGDGLTTLHRRNPRGLGPASTPVARHLRRMS